MPKIAVINDSTLAADAQIQVRMPAFETQWNRDLAPIWAVENATMIFVTKGQSPPPGAWWIVVLDDSDQAGSLAYHDLTNEGLPISKVFLKTLLAGNADLGVGASHEICEMAVDPWLNGAFQDDNDVFWANEICDPVEDDQYGYKIGDVLVSNFVTPAWFGHKNAPGPLDFSGHATGKFQILTGGYAQKYDPVKGWIQVTGAKAVATPKATASLGSRRERRARQWKSWRRSEKVWRPPRPQVRV